MSKFSIDNAFVTASQELILKQDHYGGSSFNIGDLRWFHLVGC